MASGCKHDGNPEVPFGGGEDVHCVDVRRPRHALDTSSQVWVVNPHRRGMARWVIGFTEHVRRDREHASGNHGSRVCEEPECSTVLSRYNEFDYCCPAPTMVVPRMRGKVL